MNYQEILVECAKKNGLHQIDGMDFWIKTGNLLFRDGTGQSQDPVYKGKLSNNLADSSNSCVSFL